MKIAFIFVLSLSVIANATWKLLLSHQDVDAGVFPADFLSSGVINSNNPGANTYSVIGNVDYGDYKKDDDKYAFQLVYGNCDGTTDTILWKQSSWLTQNTITGYEPISVPSQPSCPNQGCRFDGLGKTSIDKSYLDGNGDEHGNWWNAVGITTTFSSATGCNDGGVPAFNAKIAKSTKLFVWVPRWRLIFSHKNVDNGLFPAAILDTGMANGFNPDANEWSIIGATNPDLYRGINNKYEFRLIYDNCDGTTDFIHWKQSSWLTDNEIDGYQPIVVPPQPNCPNQGCRFDGLSKTSSTQAYLDGNGDEHGNWWNAVGITATHGSAAGCNNGGVPAFNQKIAKSTKLYVALGVDDKIAFAEYKCDERINVVENDVNGRITAVDGRVNTVDGRVTTVDGKVDDVDGRVDSVDGRVTDVDRRVTDVDGRVTDVDGRVDSVDGRVTTVDGKVDAVDGRVNTVNKRINDLITELENLKFSSANSFGNNRYLETTNQHRNNHDAFAETLILTFINISISLTIALVTCYMVGVCGPNSNKKQSYYSSS